MTIEPKCYVCGREGACIDGLCPDCAFKEMIEPGRAYDATFGSLPVAAGAGQNCPACHSVMTVPTVVCDMRMLHCQNCGADFDSDGEFWSDDNCDDDDEPMDSGFDSEDAES